MGFVLGIDQGRTHTRAAVSDFTGNILGIGTSAGACHAFEGLDISMSAVGEAAEKALCEAEVRARQLEILFAGMTGADWPEEYELLRNGLLKLSLCPNLRVVNDAIIAMRAGTLRNYGVIMIAGTMGNCAIRSPSGEEFIYQYYCEPDLQGGIALGTNALIKIFRSYTGREVETKLTRLVLDHYHLTSVDELCKRYYTGELKSVSELAPLVFDAAAGGDNLASGILKSFGIGYAGMAIAGLRKMDMLDIDVEVVLSGSVFKGHGPLLIDTIKSEILTVTQKAKLVNARFEPIVGAVMLGLEELGIEVTDGLFANIEQSARKYNLERHATRS